MPPLTSFLIAPRKEDHVNNNKQNRFLFDKINSVKNQCPALLENQLTANMLIDLVAGDAFVLAQPPSREDRFLKSERSAGITGSVNWHLRELHDSKLIPSAAMVSWRLHTVRTIRTGPECLPYLLLSYRFCTWMHPSGPSSQIPAINDSRANLIPTEMWMTMGTNDQLCCPPVSSAVAHVWTMMALWSGDRGKW